MTKVTIDETVYSVTVAEENVNVTVADATETVQVQIASGASDIQVISAGDGNSLISSTAGVVTTLKTISAGDNISLSDDGDTITISATEDDLSNNTTDDLTEGTNNLYYTDARVDTALGSVTGHIIPSQTDTYDLGSPTNVWRDLYLGPNSLYVDGQQIVSSDAGTIDITTDSGQNLRISAGGTLDLDSENDITRLLDPAIQLGVSNATVTVNGTLNADNINLDNLELTGTLINQTELAQNLEIRTNNGYLHANVTDLYVGPIAGAVKIDENSISTTDATQLTIEGFTNSADMTTAINTAESNANAYTDTRETAITSAYQAYADQSEADAITTSNSYADTAIANLVDSAPATLDTLNELAAALGDDPNFATTVTNSIATKWTQDNTKISNWDTAYSWGDHSVEGYLTSYTETDPIFTASPANGITATNITNWNTAYPWGDHSIVGYLTDYTVTEADVTQHQAALSITESQISDLTHYTDTDARTAISLTSSNLNELSYDNTTGVITYVSPTTVAATGQVVIDVRNTSGVAISRGDAVYLAGHSGNKILVAKADANATGEFPAIGLANSAMLNNSDGTVLVSGEMASLDTSAFAVNTVLYLSETAGELTSTRPSSENTAVQNIGKVARSDTSNGIIVVTGAGRANDVPNLATGHVFIGNGSGYEKRALTTSDVAEGTNLYYTDARAQAVIDTNTAGFITDYTVTEGDVTAHQAALSITESQISDLDHYTNADWDTQLATKTTSDLTEGSNLYYTDGRVMNWFGTTGISMLSTDIVAEGSNNLYYTDGRVNTWFGTSGLPALQSTALNMSQNFTVTGDLSSKNTIVGDSQIGGQYDLHGVTINAGDEAWAGISLVETTGGANKPINNFSNPSFSTTVYGGTEAAKTGVESGKRIFSAFAVASQDGTTPSTANFRFLSETTEQQSSTARGANFKLETTENGSTVTTVSLVVQGDTLTVNQNGNGKITSGGNLILDDDVQVTGTLDVDGNTNLKGNVTLGDDGQSDLTTFNSIAVFNSLASFANLDTSTIQGYEYAHSQGWLTIATGSVVYCTDGDAGSPCLAVFTGTNFKISSLGGNLSTT